MLLCTDVARKGATLCKVRSLKHTEIRPVDDISYVINNRRNLEVMERCRTLQEYSQFVGIVREYAETQKLSDSVMAEILQKCRAENILKEFLEKYGTEVIGMLFEVLTDLNWWKSPNLLICR